jgi:hypothetical protein
VTPQWFLYVGALSLLVLGVLQLYTRPRPPGASLYERFVNLGTMWSLICLAVGAALLMMALGYWHGPVGKPEPEPQRPSKRRHY